MSFNTLQVYNGEGTSRLCVEALTRELEREVDNNKYAIATFNGKTRAINSQNAAAIFFPGGNAAKMSMEMQALPELTAQIIMR